MRKKNAARKMTAFLLTAAMCVSVCTGFTANAQESASQQTENKEQSRQIGQGKEAGQAEGSLPKGDAKKETNTQEAAGVDSAHAGAVDTTADVSGKDDDGISEVSEKEQDQQEKNTKAQEQTEQPDAVADAQELAPLSASNLSNPRIEKDSGMTAGQKVTWDCVWFGSYPQAEVVPSADSYTAVDKSLLKSGDIIENSSLYNKLQNATGWNSNNDVIVDGNKYRRMKKSDATYAISDSGYYNWSDSDTWHYFKYEPIKWRVLKVNGNQAFLLSDIALDDQRYNTEFESITWETSTIRSWLNGYGASSNKQGKDYSSNNFIGSAFSGGEKSAIVNTSVVNDDNINYGTEGGNNTTDKIFLLSESEAYGERALQHGFVSSRDTYDEARRCKSSTYAKAMGTWSNPDDMYKGNCWWWLRSPGDFTDYAAYVNCYGYVHDYGNYVYYISDGVCAALNLNLSSNLYTYAGTVSSDGNENETGDGNAGGDEDESITSITKIPGAINNYYGVNSYKNTPTGEVYDDSIAFIKAMDNYLAGLRKVTQKDAQLVNKTTKSAAQLLKEADTATNDKMITMDATMPDTALNSVYETLAQYLDMYVDAGVSLGKIDMSASTIEISTGIVNKIRNNLDSLDFTRKVGNYTVTFKILKFMGAYTGSVNVRGNGRTYTGMVVSNSRETAKVLTTYINDMSQWAKDALYQALKSIFTELADITGIADYSKKEINALLKDKVQLLQDKGYGNLLKYWLAMRDGYDICQKIVASTDAVSLSDALKNAESIYNKIKKLDYSDEAVLNKTVVTAMNKLNNAKDNLERSLYDYISGTDSGNQDNWWNNMWSSFKSIFIQCPVDFVIYDNNGGVLGKVEDSEITCTSDIRIEMDGDVKTVIIPSEINAKIEFSGTDTGDMTCVIEQTVDGEITGRANYYSIPLSDGSAYLQDISGDYLTKSNSPQLRSDSASYAVSEYISVDNKEANITVECDGDEGGTVIGMGDYAKGSPVVLTAYPDNESVKFIGWFVGNNLVEADSVYRFAALDDVSVRAMFKTSWEKDDSYSSNVSEEYEETIDISVYKTTDFLNDVVISMAGLEDIETLNVSLKGYDKSNNLIKNTKMATQYDGVYRFVLFDLNLKKYSKTEVYDEESQLIGTIKFIGKGEENLPDSNTTNVSKPAKVTRIRISGISKKIAAGKKIKLTANITPSNASNKTVTWKSSNKKVATVNSSGVVTMKKKSGGKTVTITATAKDGSGVKATYKIKSMKGVVKKVTISGKKSMKVGKTLKLKAKVIATKSANKKLKWTSSNKKYATVSSSGKVKALKAGKGKKVKITAMATDGSRKKKSVTIKIN